MTRRRSRKLRTQLIDLENKDPIVAAFIEANEWSRAYMDLRFKHFSTCMVVTGLLGALVFQIQGDSIFGWLLADFAGIVTVLFWCIDERTGHHQRTSQLQVAQLAERLSLKQSSLHEPKPILSASDATRILFALLAGFWFAWGMVLAHS